MQWMLSTYLIVWSNIFSGDRSKEANFFPFSWQKYPGTPPGVWVGPPSSQKCWIRHFTFLSLGHSYCFAYFSRLYVTLDTLFSDNSACSNHRCWCWRCRFVCWLHAPDKTGLQVLKYFIHSLCREKATKRSENYTFLTVTITELMSMQRRVGEPANARTHDIKFFNKSEQSCIATVAILFVWVRKGPLLLFTT